MTTEIFLGGLRGSMSRFLRRLALLWLGGLALLAAAGSAHAAFVNGGFESDLDSWNIRHLRVPGAGIALANFPPGSESDLGLTPNTTSTPAPTDAVGNDSDINVSGQVRFPLYGAKSARINYLGAQNRAAAIDQTAVMTLADVDPTDGKAHVRFAIAPVLQNPGHSGHEQPYFFVEVYNVTKNKQLFYTFNFSGQSGVPWQTVGGFQYTNWQTIDIAPGEGVLDVGDQVKVTVIAAGCSQSGHSGHIYVDSGAGLTNLPGPGIKADAPEYAAANGSVDYTYSYSNQGDVPLTSTVVTIVSPQDNTPGTPRNLRIDPGSVPAACTTSVSGTAGNEIDSISCPLGTLNPGSSGTLQLSFVAPALTTGPINHGNYSIVGDAISPLLGPLVQSQITTDPLVDLSVALSDGQNAVIWGQALTYAMTVTNLGPTAVPAGAMVQELAPASLTGIAWTCAASGGAVCPLASGTGPVSQTLPDPVPVGGTLTYTIAAQADPSASGAGTIRHTATVTAPAGVRDRESSNNTATDSDPVGAGLFNLQVHTIGTGTVTSVPLGISCGASCASDQPGGAEVILYATAPAGSIFTGWSGGGCSGAATSCTVSMDASKTVTASFTIPLDVTPVVGANGSVTPAVTQPVAPGGTTSFMVMPNAGYAPVITDNCAAGGAQTGGALVGSTYTTNAIAQNCVVNFSFVNSGVATVTPSVGTGGAITPNAPKTVLNGGSVSYVVTPTTGYTSAPPTGSCPAGTWSGTTYTIAPVPADCTVNFGFLAPVAVTASVASGSGSVTPASQSVAVGGTAVVTLTPGAGQRATLAAGSTCTGGSFNADSTVFTVPGVAAACSVSFAFVPNPVVTASVLSGSGTVSPGAQSVPPGASAVVTLSPAAGLHATLHGSSTCTGGSFNADSTVYTVPGVAANCSAVFAFVPNPVVAASILSGGGTVSPATQSVMPGTNAVIVLSPAKGMRAAWDASSTCGGGSFNANFTAYTIPSVAADCTAVFRFAPAPVDANAIPTLSEWGMVLLSALLAAMVWMHRRRLGR